MEGTVKFFDGRKNYGFIEPASSADSGSLTLHDPIDINYEGDFTEANGVVNPGAAGTVEDPYVIEGWIIDASGAVGIDVTYTDSHFVIRNCVIEDGEEDNYYDGIFIHYLKEGFGIVENNRLINNNGGVTFSNVSNYVSGNNVFRNNSAGMRVRDAENIVVENNRIENGGEGLWIANSSEITLAGNTVEGTWGLAFQLLGSSYCVLENNTAKSCSSGFALTGSSNNVIKNNRIEGNFGYGFRTEDSPDPNVDDSPNNNQIYRNFFVNNGEKHGGVQAYDKYTNYWAIGGTGNYWSDWQPPSHPDSNGDGIIDEDKAIEGGANEDDYPLVFPEDYEYKMHSPSASFTYSPESNIEVNEMIQFTDTSTDGEGDITSWQWDFGNGESTTVQHPTRSYSAEGDYTVSLTVTDSKGLTDTTTRVVTVGVSGTGDVGENEETGGSGEEGDEGIPKALISALIVVGGVAVAYPVSRISGRKGAAVVVVVALVAGVGIFMISGEDDGVGLPGGGGSGSGDELESSTGLPVHAGASEANLPSEVESDLIGMFGEDEIYDIYLVDASREDVCSWYDTAMSNAGWTLSDLSPVSLSSNLEANDGYGAQAFFQKDDIDASISVGGTQSVMASAKQEHGIDLDISGTLIVLEADGVADDGSGSTGGNGGDSGSGSGGTGTETGLPVYPGASEKSLSPAAVEPALVYGCEGVPREFYVIDGSPLEDVKSWYQSQMSGKGWTLSMEGGYEDSDYKGKWEKSGKIATVWILTKDGLSVEESYYGVEIDISADITIVLSAWDEGECG